MTELQSVAAAARGLRAEGQSFLVATVVGVRGSSYRRPGARMLIAGDRWITGSVSGGCLEGDLLRRGWWHTDGAPAALVTYDSTADEGDPGWGVGFGCNGVVDVLLERGALADGSGNPAVDGLLQAAARGAACAAVTVFRSTVPVLPVGTRLIVERDGQVSSLAPAFRQAAATAGARLLRALITAGREALARGPLRPAAETITLGGDAVEALVETIVPPPALFVCGGGRDALPVVTCARQLGWDTWVWEPRQREATAARFGKLARLLVRGVNELEAAVATAARPVAVVMSHDFSLDAQALRVLLPSPALHIGVLGPRRRTEKLLADLAPKGTAHGEDPWRRLSAPAGLALGAETPEEIALAIVAEAQAVLAGETAGFLRSRPGPVHVTPARTGASVTEVAELEAAE